jgi:hypothetical protein
MGLSMVAPLSRNLPDHFGAVWTRSGVWARSGKQRRRNRWGTPQGRSRSGDPDDFERREGMRSAAVPVIRYRQH